MSNVLLNDPVLDAVSSLVAVLDAEGTILRVNRALDSAFGDVVGHRFSDALAEPENRGVVLRLIQAAAAGDASTHAAVTCSAPSDCCRKVSWNFRRVEVGEDPGLLVATGHELGGCAIPGQNPYADEQLYRTIVENAHDGIWLIDAKGNTLFSNIRMADMLGRSPEEMGRLNVMDVMDPEEQVKFLQRLERRRHGVRSTLEWPCHRKDGSILWTLVTSTPMFDEKGNLCCVLGIITDITERKRGEQALRESEERFRIVVENSPDLVFYMDADFRFTWVSRVNRRTRLTDAVGKHMVDIVGPADAERIGAVMLRVMETGKPERVDTNAQIEGVEYFYDTVLTRRSDSGGQGIGIAAYIRDVTERTRAEQALQALNETLEQRVQERTAALEAKSRDLERSERAVREQSELLKLIVDHMGDGVVVADRTGKFLLFNPAAERILWVLSPGGSVGQWPPETGFYFADRKTAVPLDELPLRRAMAGASVDDEELILRSPGCPEGRWVSVTTRPMLSEKGVRGAVSVVRDLTERKRQEEALRESERHHRELAEHNRLLVRELEHRVGNNLAALVALVSLMRDRMTRVDEFADALDVRFRAMADMHHMLRNEAWRGVGLEQMVHNVLANMGRLAICPAEERIEGPPVALSARQALPVMLIFVEWCTNSCKYGAHSHPGGRLEVEWEVLERDSSGWIRLYWREHKSGPPSKAAAPSLGTTLVEAFASRDLRGHCTMRFPEGRAEHTLEFPSSTVARGR